MKHRSPSEIYLEFQQELFRLHATYPCLHYTSAGTITPPIPLSLEPPPRTLDHLDYKDRVKYMDLINKYDNLMRSEDTFDNFDQFKQTLTFIRNNEYKIKDFETYLLNDDVWVTQHGMHSPLCWAFLLHPEKYRKIRDILGL